MSDAERSQEFVAALSGFSADLSESDICIYSIDYSFEVFGSWVLEIGNRHDRLKIAWDGRESYMTCSSASVSDSRAAKTWDLVVEEKVENGLSSKALFSAAKKLVTHLDAF